MKPEIYLQTKPYTCGPSCVMMILDYFGKNLPFNPDSENKIWSETRTNNGNLVYTTHPRLASFLMKEGFKTHLFHNYPEGFRYVPAMGKWEFRRRMKYYDKYRAVAESEGMEISIQDFDSSDISRIVSEEDSVAILFTRTGIPNYFHHILAYDSSNNGVNIACPIEGRYIATLEELDKKMSVPFGRGALIVRR